MRLPATLRPALCGALLAILAASCHENRSPDQTKPSVIRDTTIKENLPAGRFQLPTRHTPAPDFFISLPQGYTVKVTGKFPNDEFYIVRTDDPSLTDHNAITPGFMRVYVGVNPQSGYDPKYPRTDRAVTIGRAVLDWKMWREPLPDGAPYYNREIASSDFFASISPELARSPLNLHIYVAGRDSARVSDLMRAAESLSLTP